MKKYFGLLAIFLVACGGGESESGTAAVRGVTDDTIRVGSHNVMSVLARG